MERKIVKANFWNIGNNGDRNLYEDELGWNGNDTWIRDAQSTYPEDIFRYYVEIVGLNILFYWLDDENFYSIFTESTPIKVKRIYPNPDYDGRSEISKVGTKFGLSTHSDGEIIATFETPTEIWDGLKISGVTISKVFERSFIVTMD